MFARFVFKIQIFIRSMHPDSRGPCTTYLMNQVTIKQQQRMIHDPTVNSPKYSVATYTTQPSGDFHCGKDYSCRNEAAAGVP